LTRSRATDRASIQTRPRPHGLASTLVLLIAATHVLLLAGCAARTYAPRSVEEVGFTSRAHVKERNGIRVRAAVPSAEESEALLGIPVYDRGIQPIWLEITNETSQRARFAPVGVDREYFSAREVAYMHKSKYGGDAYASMERHLADQAMDRWIWPGETRSGFVFTHLRPGTKTFNVDVFAPGAQLATFSYFIDVPGYEPIHVDIDFESLYSAEEIRHLDVAGLRDALGATGCCTTDVTGEKAGLPINVVMVGYGQNLLKALLRAGWVERARAEGSEQIANAPHWMGRPADSIFRTFRSGGSERNELRVWLAPMNVDGEAVWMGQVTHYIGRPTKLGRALFDPRLDPDIDEASIYVLQLMWYSQGLSGYAWQRGSEPITAAAPARDFRDIVYFTSGLRLVMWLSGAPVSQAETKEIQWDESPG